MPRPSLPPTPAASSEIQGRSDSPRSAAEKTFNLPPPALAPNRANGILAGNKQPPLAQSPNFTLPPPPTRSRTIIQMKPKAQQLEDVARPMSHSGPRALSKKSSHGSNLANAAGKKQPSSTSVAGKKIARKTAHSVIERRRRSKMNEEFGTLKAMIPACTDHEMHKLAILQASIEYLRYLEECIVDLKTANSQLSTPLVQPQAPPPRLDTTVLDQNEDRMEGEEEMEEEEEGEEEDDDIEMGDTESKTTSPMFSPALQKEPRSYASPQSITPSPALDGQSHYHTSSYASSVSTLPSPAFGPQRHHHKVSQPHFSLSASTSPTIIPNKEQDQEATAALLMLNKDRRNPKGARGMSVKDLLSS